MRKMRLLTFIQMAESQSEMSFDLLMQELQLGPEQVEGFIIEGELLCVFVCMCVYIHLCLWLVSFDSHFAGFHFSSVCFMIYLFLL